MLDFEEQAAVNDRLLQVNENLLIRFPAASEGPAHCIVSDGNFDRPLVADEIVYIEKILAWRFLVLEAPQDGDAIWALEADIKQGEGGRWPLSYNGHSDQELAATLGALRLIIWLQENA